jgi:hypothetical protein
VADPAGKRRLAAFGCTDLEAPPRPIRPWVVRRWAVEVTCEEARAHLGVETQRPWSAQAITRTTPVLWALFSLGTLLALPLRQDAPIPRPVTAWYHKAEPTCADGLALVRRHRWSARSVVHSAPQAECVPFPRGAFELLLTGLPCAAELTKVECNVFAQLCAK